MRFVISNLKPIAKAGLESVKEQGIRAIRDIASEQNIKQVLKRRGRKGIKRPEKKNYRHIKFAPDVFDQKIKMMQNGSCECSKSELDIHSIPSTMTTMQDSQWM